MAETMTLEPPSAYSYIKNDDLVLPKKRPRTKVSVKRGSQELSGKERRTRIYELLYFVPSAVLKQLTKKKLENLLVAHRCAVCEKVFRLSKGVKAHKEDAHATKRKKLYVNIKRMTNMDETLLDLSVISGGSTELGHGGNILEDEKRRESMREKAVLNYNEKFNCDYECGFSTKVLAALTKHIKRHHAATTTSKIKDVKKHRDENGNTDIPRQQRSSDFDFTDKTIPDPKGSESQVSCIQEAKSPAFDNKTEATIVISDDEEEVATQKNIAVSYTEVSEANSNVTSFKAKFNQGNQDYSASVMYPTTPKAKDEDSETSKSASVSAPFSGVNVTNVNQIDTTEIISDDDESTQLWKPGSAKKKHVSKRLFSNFPLKQNQVGNVKKLREDMLEDGLIKHSKENVNEPLDMLSRLAGLGPGITVTKTSCDNSTKASSDNSNNEQIKEAIDKIRRLGPSISFIRRSNK